MLRYEQIIKDKLEVNNVKLLSIEQDGRMIVTDKEGNQRIFRAQIVGNNNVKAVSYTHLDVYKRQVLH